MSTCFLSLPVESYSWANRIKEFSLTPLSMCIQSFYLMTFPLLMENNPGKTWRKGHLLGILLGFSPDSPDAAIPKMA